MPPPAKILARTAYENMTAGEIPRLEDVRRLLYNIANEDGSMPEYVEMPAHLAQSSTPIVKPQDATSPALPVDSTKPATHEVAPTDVLRVSESRTGSKETNSSLRKKLGQYGWLPDSTRQWILDGVNQEVLSWFVRRGQEIVLHEVIEGSSKQPYLTTVVGAIVHVEDQGVRNPSLKLPNEGRQAP